MRPCGVAHLFFYRIVLAFLLIPAGSAAAGQGIEAFAVRSVYRIGSARGWGQETRWIFQRTAPAEWTVRNAGEPEPRYLLRYGEDRRLRQVFLIGKDKDGRPGATAMDLFAAGAYVLSDGFPLPFDDLDPGSQRQETVAMKKTAGGTGFAFQLTRRVEDLTVEAAVARGMIAGTDAARLSGKRMRTISMEKGGEPMVRQLWVEGDDWWVYEETPFRRSWRVME